MITTWSGSVTAAKPYAHLSQRGDIEIRACSLEDVSKPSKLFCSVDGKQKYALCKVTPEAPSCRIGGGLKGLAFEEDVTLSCEGGPIRLHGLMMVPELSGGMMEMPKEPPPPSLAKREFLDKLRDDMLLGQAPNKKQKTTPAQAPAKKEEVKVEKPREYNPTKPAAAPKTAAEPKGNAPAPKGNVFPDKKAAPKQEPEKKKEPEKKEPAKPPAPDPQASKKRLPSGLQYEVLRPGKQGKAFASRGKTVQVQYDGRLARSGKRFDKGKIKFRLGAGEVIAGWDQGVAGMLVGERRRLLIPAHLGYGRQGAPGAIPPNADLVFEVELLSV